mmetsp:Transcript_66954/g.160353  ORF Transcript_66954/g.160353 Transcript_66954/m.160353 type:complete len:128 (+) Transcript_66954:310-693(+)
MHATSALQRKRYYDNVEPCGSDIVFLAQIGLHSSEMPVGTRLQRKAKIRTHTVSAAAPLQRCKRACGVSPRWAMLSHWRMLGWEGTGSGNSGRGGGVPGGGCADAQKPAELGFVSMLKMGVLRAACR